MKPSLLVIAGPTASGKTGLAVDLALEFDAEIVGADSMQVYRGMDIGTAKPTKEELRGVPRRLFIDVVDPDWEFDAAQFVETADEAIADIAKRGKKILVVGGTGLYLRALLRGMHDGPGADPVIRSEISEQAADLGWPAIHEKLALVDPETAGRLHPNDGVRISRALEVYRISGRTIASWHKEHGFAEDRYPHIFLALERPRDELNARIEKRVDIMMDDGFLAEVEGLIQKGYTPELKPMQGLGYKRLCQHLNDEMSLNEAVEKTKTDTRRFAKRQHTWFRKEPALQWVEPSLEKLKEKSASFWR